MNKIKYIKENELHMIDADYGELERLIKENNQLIKELEVFNKWNPV